MGRIANPKNPYPGSPQGSFLWDLRPDHKWPREIINPKPYLEDLESGPQKVIKIL